MQTVECEDEFDRRILTQGGNEQVKCGLRESLSFVNPHDISPLDTLDVDGAALTETLEAYGAAGEQTGDGRFGDAPRQRKLGLEVNEYGVNAFSNGGLNFTAADDAHHALLHDVGDDARH